MSFGQSLGRTAWRYATFYGPEAQYPLAGHGNIATHVLHRDRLALGRDGASAGPALAFCPLLGVANRSIESSQCTAKALGLRHAFAKAAELVASPDIDLVAVTVKVSHHLEFVTAALEAGKHVYCEWPLGNGLEEARRLADLAEEKGVVAVAGTQARAAVEVEYLSKLIADGYVGRVLSTTLIGSGGNWAGETAADYAYLFDATNGATMQSIPLAHALAAVKDVLGPKGGLSARFINRFETVKVTDTGTSAPRPPRKRGLCKTRNETESARIETATNPK